MISAKLKLRRQQLELKEDDLREKEKEIAAARKKLDHGDVEISILKDEYLNLQKILTSEIEKMEESDRTERKNEEAFCVLK